MAVANNTGFLSKAFEDLNAALAMFAENFSAGIANEITPVVIAGLTLSFIILGLMAIRGLLDSPFMDVAAKLMKSSIIIAIALTSATYQTYIIDVLLTVPDDIVSSIVKGSISGNSNVQSGNGAAVAIEEMYDLGASKAQLYFDEISLGLGLFEDTNLLPFVYGILVWLGTVLCCIIGLLWLVIAKVVLSIMLGVGPIFICCLIWQPTQQFFWSWVGQILNTILTSVMVLAIFAVFAAIFKTQLEQLQVNEDTANFANAAVFAFLGVLCCAVLVVIPQYVSALTGAAGGAVGTMMSQLSKGAIDTGKATGSAGVSMGRSAMAANSARNAYQQARAGGASRMQAARTARHEYNKSMAEMKQGYPDYFRKMPSQPQPQSQPQAAASSGGNAGVAAIPQAKPVQGTGSYGKGNFSYSGSGTSQSNVPKSTVSQSPSPSSGSAGSNKSTSATGGNTPKSASAGNGTAGKSSSFGSSGSGSAKTKSVGSPPGIRDLSYKPKSNYSSAASTSKGKK